MPDTLLSTKLYIPRPYRELVSRPRLTERLDAALQQTHPDIETDIQPILEEHADTPAEIEPLLTANAKGTALMAVVFHGAINAASGYLGFDAVKAGPYFIAVELVVALIFIFVAGAEHLSRKNKRNVVELEEG